MPNDPSKTPEWSALTSHARSMKEIHMRDLFAADEARAEKLSLELEGVFFDFSKHLITQETLEHLTALAAAQNLEQARDQMFNGEAVNNTENRAALHTALRGSTDEALEINGENVNDFVQSSLKSLKEFSDTVRSENKYNDIVNIGIGGSDLGPHMLSEALTPFHNGPRVHFVSNLDGAHLSQILAGLSPEKTLCIIASKTFTTSETMANAQSAKAWLGEHAPNNLAAVTAAPEKAQDFGIAYEFIFPMRDWIGGRYSLWSAIGLPIMLAVGCDNFERLLEGAKAADTHFKSEPLSQNIPVIMALLTIWYRNFMSSHAMTVIPYVQNLRRLPAYIQQLEMESNGKSVSREGEPLNYDTAPVIFGEPGTNAQHAFFQMLHQGKDLIPCDFIAAIKPDHDLDAHHEKLLASVLGQSQALMQGQDNDNAHQNFPGNKPGSTILLPQIDPYYMGMLLALYEHKVFVEGVIWNINSFDQWGVELGKSRAQNMLSAFHNGDMEADSSTKALLKRVKQSL